MKILRDRKADGLYLSQKGNIKKVFYRFNILNVKAVNASLVAHFKLSFFFCVHGQMMALITCHEFLIQVQLDCSYILYFVYIQIWHVRLVDTWQILLRNIEKQYSGYLDIAWLY